MLLSVVQPRDSPTSTAVDAGRWTLSTPLVDLHPDSRSECFRFLSSWGFVLLRYFFLQLSTQTPFRLPHLRFSIEPTPHTQDSRDLTTPEVAKVTILLYGN